MGNELASFDEWNEQKSLPWELKRFPKHDSISRMFHDLNLIYAGHKALYFEEHNPAHFQWLIADDCDHAIYAFQRKVDDDVVIAVFNMTPNYYEYINIPLFEEGEYEEIFNSDKDVYGGWNQYNGLPCKSFQCDCWGKPFAMSIKLASFGACYFKKKK